MSQQTFNEAWAKLNMPAQIEREIAEIINRHSLENASDTPDYILAAVALKAIKNYSEMTNLRAVHLEVETHPWAQPEYAEDPTT